MFLRRKKAGERHAGSASLVTSSRYPSGFQPAVHTDKKVMFLRVQAVIKYDTMFLERRTKFPLSFEMEDGSKYYLHVMDEETEAQRNVKQLT